MDALNELMLVLTGMLLGMIVCAVLKWNDYKVIRSLREKIKGLEQTLKEKDNEIESLNKKLSALERERPRIVGKIFTNRAGRFTYNFLDAELNPVTGRAGTSWGNEQDCIDALVKIVGKSSIIKDDELIQAEARKGEDSG